MRRLWNNIKATFYPGITTTLGLTRKKRGHCACFPSAQIKYFIYKMIDFWLNREDMKKYMYIYSMHIYFYRSRDEDVDRTNKSEHVRNKDLNNPTVSYRIIHVLFHRNNKKEYILLKILTKIQHNIQLLYNLFIYIITFKYLKLPLK